MKLDHYLSKHTQLRLLYKIVKQEFLAKGLVHHSWNHVLRDLANGIIVGETEKANMKIVLAGILLHDIGRLYPTADEDHYSIGAKKAPERLERCGFTHEEIKEITHCIRTHGPRGMEEPQTLEAKVCYDVDVLSCSVGHIGVARVFDYFMREENVSVAEMLRIPSGKKGPRKNFYTQSGRALGNKGLQKATKFWQELTREFDKQD